jgi:hypothetical protein
MTTAWMTNNTVMRGALLILVSEKGINYLTHHLLNAESKEPDHNHAAARIIKNIEKWYLSLFFFSLHILFVRNFGDNDQSREKKDNNTDIEIGHFRLP